jgi:cell wall assembly regulator SMI1
MTSTAIMRAWANVESRLGTSAPSRKELPPAASADALASLQKAVGVDLPAPFREAWSAHDGTGDVPIAGWRLLSTQAIEKQWLALCERKWPKAGIRSVGPLQATAWSSRWIPFAVRGQVTLLCLDFLPGIGGLKGQILEVGLDTLTRRVVAASFGAWWSHVASQVDEGRRSPMEELEVEVTQPLARSLQQQDIARNVLATLHEEGVLTLTEGHDVEELVQGSTEALARSTDPTEKAHHLTNFLLEHPAVDELYASEEELIEVIAY